MGKNKGQGRTKKLQRTATYVQGKYMHIDKAGAPARTANVVRRVALNPDAPPKATVRGIASAAYFKAFGNMAPGQYAVASTRLARFLGMEDAIAHNAFGQKNGVRGVVSGAVPGSPLVSYKKDREVTIPQDVPKKEHAAYADERQYEERDGKYYDTSKAIYEWVDFRDAAIQKGLSDLQLFDAITGQQDRHGGNIFISETGQVSGIDDDFSFGRGMSVADQAGAWGGKYVGLPALVDKDTAERILALDPTKLPDELAPAVTDSKALTEKEIEDAMRRFEGVRLHLRQLQKNGDLVGQNKYPSWNDATYQQAKQNPKTSYLGRSAKDLEDVIRQAANDPDFVVRNAPQPQPQPSQPVATTVPQPPEVMPPLPRTPWQRPTVPPRLPPITLPQPSTSLGPESPRTGEGSPSRATAARLAAAWTPRRVQATLSTVEVDGSGDPSDNTTTPSADDQLLSKQ